MESISLFILYYPGRDIWSMSHAVGEKYLTCAQVGDLFLVPIYIINPGESNRGQTPAPPHCSAPGLTCVSLSKREALNSMRHDPHRA